MKIQDQAFVTLTYVLREKDENGRLIQETTKDNPFTFVCGMQQVLPKFEENLMGKEPGDTYCFYLTPEEGYGVRDESQVMEFEKEMFMKSDVLKDMLKVGLELPFRNYNGGIVMGKICEIGDQTVKVDFNSDLAGVHLCFSGEILDVRESTDEDFNPGGCSGCGGSCDGGCEGCK